MSADQTALKTCIRCLRKAVCTFYYRELDLRFGKEHSKDLVGIINQLDNELAQKCEFYLQETGHVSEATT
ncbi:MAG: hypothetical protein V3S51_05330 [Dehalococcoidia bacterium]